jgi:hypothetical protein
MENTARFEEMRKSVLDEVDRAEKKFKRSVKIMAVVEGSLLTIYLCLMNFHERLHWLILVAALLTYGTITMGLMGVVAQVELNARRVIKAIKLGSESQ